ncbi:hypothetical protein O2N63_03690 [Aliiroseovarius sp. KMU-50]|uniref:Porin family protein n=1 Tax=Aliiroseovarius salicola TaxID=3009082 RepID=A0ABT4VY40_9RHOB|nr:hypothetical protein [Aliiroseovarius sp. KMU-50]MDA5093181.1 hypothetical protein [Aliiroseovarius sp. KMU-50]
MITLRSLVALMAAVSCQMPPSPAEAGAWPRKDGEWFISIQATQDWGNWVNYPKVSTYLEYGLTDVWTIGGRIEHDLQTYETSEAELFVRRAFPTVLTWQLAAGMTFSETTEGTLSFKPSFHLGKGFETRWGNGWMDALIKVELPVEEGAGSVGAFAQIGLKPHECLLTMISVDAHADKFNTTVKLLPSLAWEVRPGRHIQVEWSETVTPAPEGKLSLGIWMSF